jgi:phosphoribosylanthranilate isomerase
MLIKICGLKYADNIDALAKLSIDMMGFIFYPKSPRYVNDVLDSSTLEKMPKTIKKVGVFVNASTEEILSKQKQFQLDYIQLHGDENTDFCKQLKEKECSIIKAFQIDDQFDFTVLNTYQNVCDYFLFDTKTHNYGGSGKAFNWSVLDRYTLLTPFLLSGGIGLENINEAIMLRHPQLIGFDINSKIELEPAIKSIDKAELLIKKIRHHE